MIQYGVKVVDKSGHMAPRRSHETIGYKFNSPHSAVPYSFQCERVLAVIATVLVLTSYLLRVWNEIILSTDFNFRKKY